MKSSHLPETDTLSLREQVAQMVVVRASGYLFHHEIKYPQWELPAAKLQHLIYDLGVGGVILLGGSATELALRSQQLQSWAKIPLLSFGSLPLRLEKLINLRNLILVDDLLDSKLLSRQAPAVTIPQQLGYRTQLGDRNLPVIPNPS